MGMVDSEGAALRTINEVCHEVVQEALNEKAARQHKAKVLRGVHRDYTRFWKDRLLNPYLCVNVYECLDNPSAVPIMLDKNFKKNESNLDNEFPF